MRLKFVFTLLLLVVVVLGATFLLKQPSGNTVSPTRDSETAGPNDATVVVPPSETTTTAVTPPLAVAPAVTNTLTPKQRLAIIEAETVRLQEWSMNDDPVSLSNILADLTSPEQEVRQAAIEAAEQFGSTNAIPVLKALAANTADSDERAALLDAADFLSLPSIVEVGQSKTPAEREARRQARKQKQTGTQTVPGLNPTTAPGP